MEYQVRIKYTIKPTYGGQWDNWVILPHEYEFREVAQIAYDHQSLQIQIRAVVGNPEPFPEGVWFSVAIEPEESSILSGWEYAQRRKEEEKEEQLAALVDAVS